jgi:hypothetical protein
MGRILRAPRVAALPCGTAPADARQSTNATVQPVTDATMTDADHAF